MMSDNDELREQLESYIGRPGAPSRVADDAVNAPMIRHWCQALGDANAAYSEATRTGTIVAPPAMLQTWTHHDRRFERSVLSNDEGEELIARMLADAGFPSVVATDYHATYVRYLVPGDRLSYSSMIEGISQRKQTALGDGYFITTKATYVDQNDDVVGELRLVTLRFRPAASDS
jgi:uncharacterized protein